MNRLDGWTRTSARFRAIDEFDGEKICAIAQAPTRENTLGPGAGWCCPPWIARSTTEQNNARIAT
jgi:hypothetical protein